MKKIFFALVFICFSLSSFAQTISQQEARVVAEQFFNSHSSNTRAGAERKIVQSLTISNAEEPSFYAFNCEGKNGFVLVAADARISDPIIGFSDSGSFDTSEMNDEQKGWIEIMKRSLANYAQAPARTRAVSYEDPVPALIDAEWNQGYPYNLMCPKDENGRNYVTGCVITATAQVMYYHKWPEKGQGQCSYTCGTAYGSPVLSADFSQSTYRWDLMTPTYDKNSSEESCNAVALLMKDLGIAGNAGYGGLGGTGASSLGYALIKYFDYDKSMKLLERNYCTGDDYENILLSEFRQGRPVLMDGGNSAGVGDAHEYVVDGFNSSGYYHVNFGWGGSSNGYYQFGAFGYDVNTGITYDIKKNEGGAGGFTVGSNKDFWFDGNSLTGEMVFKHFHQASIKFALAIENIETNEVLYDLQNINSALFQIKSSLTDGNYKIYPVVSGDGKNWKNVYFYDNRQTFVDLNVKDGVYTYSNNHISDPLDEGKVVIDNKYYILNEKNKTASLTFRNDKYNSYKGNIIIPEYVNYCGSEYLVTSIGDAAFKKCKELISVEIPVSIDSIEHAAFSNSSIEEIKIPEGSKLKYIGGWAFNGAVLKDINLPEGFIETSSCAFQSCPLRKISLPSTFKKISNSTFNACGNIETIKVGWPKPPTNFDLFYSIKDKSECTLYVPKGTKKSYESSKYWSDFINIVEFDNNGNSSEQILVNSIELNHATYDLKPGETLRLVATVLPENATNKDVTWSSNNEKVVKVDATGLVTFIDYGDAVVKATAADGSGVTATCTFSNVDGIETITVDGGNVEIYTLDGKKVQQTGKGVFIINGKKVLRR